MQINKLSLMAATVCSPDVYRRWTHFIALTKDGFTMATGGAMAVVISPGLVHLSEEGGYLLEVGNADDPGEASKPYRFITGESFPGNGFPKVAGLTKETLEEVRSREKYHRVMVNPDLLMGGQTGPEL